MIELIIVFGLFFLSVGTFGLIRLSGTYNRMHATSKATTMGTGLILLAGAVNFYPEKAAFQAVIAIFFLFITAPTGAHLIARATFHQQGERTGSSKKDDLSN